MATAHVDQSSAKLMNARHRFMLLGIFVIPMLYVVLHRLREVEWRRKAARHNAVEQVHRPT